MGIWSIMPLLSTLAALVIIVHSAEEERGYRRDLRPRAVDTASYEQPWRAIDSEPLIQQSTRAESWNESPEEIPERRRPIRKRKRRPHPYPDGEPLERYQESIQGRHPDYHDSEQIPEARKRRKRPDFNYQTPDEPARPLRKRGLRRKRPTDYDIPLSKVAGKDNYENQRPQNYSKYNQFNEYDVMEQTEKSKVYSTSIYTSDNLTNQPYAFDNGEYADMLADNRPIAYKEKHDMLINGNTKGNGVYNMHPFHESSSSEDDDSQERPNINQETNKLPSERIVAKAESHPDNDAKIMFMIKKSKVQNGPTGIIITGTERNYFPVSMPAEIVYTDSSNLSTTEEASNSVILNDTGPNHISLPIPADEAYVDYSDLWWKEESKLAIINATEQDYFFSPIPAEVPYTAHHDLLATKGKPNIGMAQTINGTKHNYFPLPLPNHFHFHFHFPAGVAYTNNNILNVTSEKSSTTSNNTSNNIATTKVTTTTESTITNITIPLDKIPTMKSNGVNNSGYDNDLIIYDPATEPTTKYATTASTYDGDDKSKSDINIDYRNKDSNITKYLYFTKFKQDVVVTDDTLKNNETAAKTKTKGLISDYGGIEPKHINFQKSKPDVVFAYGTSKNHELIPKIVAAHSKHSREKWIAVMGVNNSNIEPKYIHFPKINQDVVIGNGISKNDESAAELVAISTRSKCYPKNSKDKINLSYVSNESKNLSLQISNQYDDVTYDTSKNIESTTKIAETASKYNIEKIQGIQYVDFGTIEPKYIKLPKSKSFTNKSKTLPKSYIKLPNVVTSSKNNEPAPNFVQTDFRHNIEKFKGVPNIDYGSREPKYINRLKSKQDVVVACTSKNNEPAPKFVQTDFRNNIEKWKGILNVDYGSKEPKPIHFQKSNQDITYGTSKNNEPLAKIVATTSTFVPKSKGEKYLDSGSKESQNKRLTLVLSKSKQDTFTLGSSKNDESIKNIVASASHVYTEENNGIVNVDHGSIKSKYNYLPKAIQDVIAYGTSKYIEPEITMASTDLKNVEESNEVIYPDYETIESKRISEESHGLDNLRYNKKKKPKYVILRTIAQKPSDFWDIVPKKRINTDKWNRNIKQIPMITPVEYQELPSLEEEFEENGVIDPLMLKQILKRSNGTSLSEILQQHNLSLSDLLQGKNEAISALNISASQESKSQIHDISLEKYHQLNEAESKYPTVKQKSSEQKVKIESSSDEDTNETTTPMVENVTDADDSEIENQTIKPRMSARRRFPSGIRRKLRMRPTLNSTLKAQLSRDLIALTARKYSHNNRNVTKSREWKEIVPLMLDRSTDKTNGDATETAIPTTDAPIDTTISNLEISNSSYSLSSVPDTSDVNDNEVENTAITTTEATTTITIEVNPPFEIDNETEKPKVTPIVRPAANNSVLRRQAFNNRLKRKRLKQKSTTENPSDDLMKNFLGMANLVSASQFIERTQKPYTTKQENTEYATELEDFMTTKTPTTVDGGIKSTQTSISSSTSTTIKIPQTSTSTSTTEQSAKFEIEEILNDTMTSERLAKILRERNMTLSELVNHRERGSSHVHLADIFHNASKEPNPPEPFLTKSSIEPISKETYPLRAILEANTHETTTRTSSQEQKNYLHIPVVMDFGNNVNENSESMGIISLFNKLTDSEITIDKTQIRKDSDGTPYVSSVISVNATANDTIREGRVLNSDENENWNDLLSFMKDHNISTFEEELQGLNKGDTEKDSIEDLDGDGLMLLDDMQHLQNFESNIAPGSDENIEIKMFERREHLSEKPGILNKLPNNTKSVAIATASILGLAAILFLLTYIAFKWKQQRNKLRKKESFCVDQIPSPVFENRKTHKNNCSSRSISPMISNTNIYMSTLESHNGKESPDYMWNSLRKPFQ